MKDYKEVILSAIHDLIDQVSDSRLRERLAIEWANASKEKKFGLVFEDHLPELLPLYDIKPSKGDLVCRRLNDLKDVWQVVSINSSVATCIKPSDATRPSKQQRADDKTIEIPLDELLVVREFGEPIFPSLVTIDTVTNGAKDSPWHSLIEADNYHALQLLNYLYASQVDCIYIDPPYNTGARDWKYNNNYVDRNDGWRHSKWLAFMSKRLKLAKSLLNPVESVLIIAIDDNELFSLGLLLDDIFAGNSRQVVNITINPKGKARDGRLSQVDEYLIIVYIGNGSAGFIGYDESASELRWPYLKRSDIESARGTKKGGVRQFYPIYVNEATGKIEHVGDWLTPDQPLEDVPKRAGCVAVFPIKEDGKHMNWGLTSPSLEKAIKGDFVRVSKSKNPYQAYNLSYVTDPSIKKIERGEYLVTGTRPDGTKVVSIPNGRSIRATTSWKKNTYDANTYGTQMIGDIVPGQNFSFPKSIYSVFDVLKVFLQDKEDALIVDFFAGSGTTLNAVNLLNAVDGGKRRCVLVTNNEVSAQESETLSADGFHQGDEEWEAKGICRSITWPRSKYTILGKRDDGSKLAGEYFTGRKVEKNKARVFKQISFIDPSQLDTNAKKKQLVSIFKNLPQSLVKDNCSYIVSEKHDTSILFDPENIDEWLEALEGQKHITDFYIVTPTKKIFDSLKAKVSGLLGSILVLEEEKRAMGSGFSTNLAYFKLTFLQKERVSLGLAFREILPLLWLKAGAVGSKPELKSGEDEPSLFAPKDSNLIVLLDETRISSLLKVLERRSDVSHVFIVTDADESFRFISQNVREVAVKNNPDLQLTQLYRDYLHNFMINKNQDRAVIQTSRLGTKI